MFLWSQTLDPLLVLILVLVVVFLYVDLDIKHTFSNKDIFFSPSSKLQSREDAGGVVGRVVGANVVVIKSAQLILSLM